eukprot:SAG31_NODE_31599_length_366_cov_0.779026_1_plen_69_part_01
MPKCLHKNIAVTAAWVGRNGSWARQPGGTWFRGQGGVTEGCRTPKTAPGTGQQRRRGRGGERRHRGGAS